MAEISLDLSSLHSALREKDYPRAVTCLEPLLKQHPQIGRLWAYRAQLALDTGEVLEARRFALYALACGDREAALDILAKAFSRTREAALAYEICRLLARKRAADSNAAVRAGAFAFQAGLPDDALDWFAEAARRDPLAADPWTNRGYVLKVQGDFGRAIDAYDEGVRRAPEDADLRWNRALCLLTMGRYREGLEESEWRWKKPNFPSKPRGFVQPLWRGEHVDVLLLHAEQGFGDCLQMLRYVPLAAPRVGRIILEIQPELFRLAKEQLSQQGIEGRLFPGNVELVVQSTALPPFDAHAPLMTLPLSLGLDDMAHPPRPRPYIYCKPGMVFGDLQQPDRPLNVGFAWRGRPTFAHNQLRSFGLEDMAPLFSVPGVRWFSLQKSPGADVAAELQQARVTAVDLGAQAQDFLDTATYLKSLDLFITTDTSVAHLAGALGVETWVAVMKIPDWRWGLEGERCAWYDSLRLFRQQQAGEWKPVFSAMADALAVRLAEPARAQA